MQGFGDSPIEVLTTRATLAGAIFVSHFTYNIAYLDGTATDIAANGTTAAQLQINADSDFVCQAINLVSWSAADTLEVDPDYTLLLTVAGSGRQLMNQAVAVLNICGNYTDGQVPARRNMPFLLSANTTLTSTIVNRSATAVNRCDLTFDGYKVFYNEKATRTSVFPGYNY